MKNKKAKFKKVIFRPVFQVLYATLVLLIVPILILCRQSWKHILIASIVCQIFNILSLAVLIYFIKDHIATCSKTQIKNNTISNTRRKILISGLVGLVIFCGIIQVVQHCIIKTLDKQKKGYPIIRFSIMVLGILFSQILLQMIFYAKNNTDLAICEAQASNEQSKQKIATFIKDNSAVIFYLGIPIFLTAVNLTIYAANKLGFLNNILSITLTSLVILCSNITKAAYVYVKCTTPNEKNHTQSSKEIILCVGLFTISLLIASALKIAADNLTKSSMHKEIQITIYVLLMCLSTIISESTFYFTLLRDQKPQNIIQTITVDELQYDTNLEYTPEVLS